METRGIERLVLGGLIITGSIIFGKYMSQYVISSFLRLAEHIATIGQTIQTIGGN